MRNASGSFDRPFQVDVIIDGHGDTFNAAEATVQLSEAVQVEEVVLGDCNLSFLTTPSRGNLSFSGVILSGSAKKCTAYTVMLSPTAKGKASLTFSDAAVRQYGDAADVLSSVKNGSFTLTGTAGKKVQK